MARNCLERGEEIYTAAKKEQRPLALFRLASPSPTASPTQLLPGPSPLIGNGKVSSQEVGMSVLYKEDECPMYKGTIVKTSTRMVTF